jgi:hypothetical protein
MTPQDLKPVPGSDNIVITLNPLSGYTLASSGGEPLSIDKSAAVNITDGTLTFTSPDGTVTSYGKRTTPKETIVSTYDYVGLFCRHDSGEIELYRDGKMVAKVKAIEAGNGVVTVTAEDGTAHTFGKRKPTPKLTPAPLPPSQFPNVHQAIADFFGCREDDKPTGSIEDQVASVLNR